MECAYAHLEALEPRLFLAAAPAVTALPQLLNLPTEGSITVTGASGDGVDDAYEFTMAAAGRLTLNLTSVGTASLTVFDAVTGRRLTTVKPRKAAAPVQVTLAVRASQQLRVVTGDGAIAPGSYTLALTATPTDDISASFAKARRALIGRNWMGLVAGNANYIGDGDTFSVVALRDGSITAELTPRLKTSGLAVRLEAYDASGQLLAIGPAPDQSGVSAVTFTVTKGQTYYVTAVCERGAGVYAIRMTNNLAPVVPPDSAPQPGAAVQARLVSTAAGLVLVISGTDAGEALTLGYANGAYALSTPLGTQYFNDKLAAVEVHMFGGDDTVRVTSEVAVPTSIYGYDGNDVIFAANSVGMVEGGDGDDLIISIGGVQTVSGGAGADTFWLDSVDTLTDGEASEARRTHRISRFQNVSVSASGAGRAVVGASSGAMSDPAITGAAAGYADFGWCPLYVGGVSASDVVNGGAADGAFLTSVRVLAQTDPQWVEQMIVPLGDGTYAVDFSSGGQSVFVRIDADLPVTADGTLAYAQLSPQGEIWVPMLEKAYATLRAGSTYDTARQVKSGMLAQYQAAVSRWYAQEAVIWASGYYDRAHASTDASDIVFGLAWYMQGYMSMYQATGNIRLLEQVKSDIDWLLSVRDDALGRMDEVRGRIVKSWSSIKDTGSMLPENVGKRHTLALFAGNILQPIASWLQAAKSDPLLRVRYAAEIETYTRAVQETIAEFDEDWREAVRPGENQNADRHGFSVQQGEGYYYCPAQGNPTSYNRQNAMGRTLIAMYKVTGRQDYLDKATKLARFFARAAIRTAGDGGYAWYGSYWTTGTAKMEDTGHAGTSVQFMVDAYRAGIVFGKNDMAALARAFDRFTQRDANGKAIGWTWRIDGTDTSDATNLLGGASLWLSLGMVESSVTQTFIDRGDGVVWLHTGGWFILSLLDLPTDQILS
jgi:hypothetical protein